MGRVIAGFYNRKAPGGTYPEFEIPAYRHFLALGYYASGICGLEWRPS